MSLLLSMAALIRSMLPMYGQSKQHKINKKKSKAVTKRRARNKIAAKSRKRNR
jgi:hypothetical protein